MDYGYYLMQEMLRDMVKQFIEDLLKCRCEIQILMAHGCQCGGT